MTGVFTDRDPKAYAISAYSYLVTPEHQMNPAQGAVLGQFVEFLACQGQQSAEQLGYSPLPPNLVDDDFQGIKRIAGAAPPPPTVNAQTCNDPYVSLFGSSGPPQGGAEVAAVVTAAEEPEGPVADPLGPRVLPAVRALPRAGTDRLEGAPGFRSLGDGPTTPRSRASKSGDRSSGAGLEPLRDRLRVAAEQRNDRSRAERRSRSVPERGAAVDRATSGRPDAVISFGFLFLLAVPPVVAWIRCPTTPPDEGGLMARGLHAISRRRRMSSKQMSGACVFQRGTRACSWSRQRSWQESHPASAHAAGSCRRSPVGFNPRATMPRRLQMRDPALQHRYLPDGGSRADVRPWNEPRPVRRSSSYTTSPVGDSPEIALCTDTAPLSKFGTVVLHGPPPFVRADIRRRDRLDHVSGRRGREGTRPDPHIRMRSWATTRKGDLLLRRRAPTLLTRRVRPESRRFVRPRRVEHRGDPGHVRMQPRGDARPRPVNTESDFGIEGLVGAANLSGCTGTSKAIAFNTALNSYSAVNVLSARDRSRSPSPTTPKHQTSKQLLHEPRATTP